MEKPEKQEKPEKPEKPISKHKPHFCIFCKTEVKKISWHFTKKHKNEERIKAIMSLNNKRERFWAWKRLTQEGDHFFNTQINSLKSAKKTVKESNRPSINNRYYDCPNCMGRLRTSYRNQHLLVCGQALKQPVESNPVETKRPVDMFDKVPEFLINKIRKSQYLSYFLAFVHEEKGEKSRIRTMITLLTDLEKALREIRNERKKSLTYFLKPMYVSDFLKSIKMLCGENWLNEEKLLRNPYRADQLFRIICRMAQFFSVFYEKKNMACAAKDALQFLNKFEAEFKNSFKKQVDRAFRVKQCLKTPKLPKTRDLLALTRMLKDETPTLLARLRENQNSARWRALADNILCRLVIFDRKPTAAVRMKISDYTSFKSKSTMTTEKLYSKLSKEERRFLTKIKIIEVNKGNGNIVPVFVKTEMLEAMDVLLEFRDFGDIYSQNDYFFAATKKSVQSLKVTNTLRRYRGSFPREVRDCLTVKNIFRHAVKMAQKLRFSAEEKRVWSLHMKHLMSVEKRNYSYQEQKKGILIVGRVLMALDNGTLKYYKGKRVTTIPLTLLPQVITEKSAEIDKKENTSTLCRVQEHSQIQNSLTSTNNIHSHSKAVEDKEEKEEMTTANPNSEKEVENNKAPTTHVVSTIVYGSVQRRNEERSPVKPTNDEVWYDKFSDDENSGDSNNLSGKGPLSIEDLINFLYVDVSNDERSGYHSGDNYDYESNTRSEYHPSNKKLYEIKRPWRATVITSKIMRFHFISRTVLVKNNNVEEAMGVLNRLMGREGLLDDARRCMYYEKPWQTRKRINFERCKAVFNEEMTRKINFLSRKNREHPYPGCY